MDGNLGNDVVVPKVGNPFSDGMGPMSDGAGGIAYRSDVNGIGLEQKPLNEPPPQIAQRPFTQDERQQLMEEQQQRMQQAQQESMRNQQATQRPLEQPTQLPEQPPQLPPVISGSGGGLGSLGQQGLGGGGQQNLNLGQVGLTFSPSGQGGGQDKGYTGWSFAEGGNVNTQGMAGLNAGNMGFMSAALGGASQKEGLREIDILNSYFRQANIPPQQSLKMLKQVIQSGVTFKRAGNTMMGSKPLPPNASQVYFFTIDQLDGFVVAVKQLLGGLKQTGVQTVYLNKIDPTIVQAMQAAGATPQQSDRPEYKIMAAI